MADLPHDWQTYPTLHTIDGPPMFELAGRAYVSLTSSGIKEQGAPVASTFNSANDAWQAYCGHLIAYIANRPRGVIAWRVKPEAREQDGKHWIYSRLTVVERLEPQANDSVLNGAIVGAPADPEAFG